jgi:hypothetical protein
MKSRVRNLRANMVKLGSMREFMSDQKWLAPRANIFDKVLYFQYVCNYVEIRKLELIYVSSKTARAACNHT